MTVEHSKGLEDLLESKIRLRSTPPNTHKTKEEVKNLTSENSAKSSFWKWLLPLPL